MIGPKLRAHKDTVRAHKETQFPGVSAAAKIRAHSFEIKRGNPVKTTSSVNISGGLDSIYPNVNVNDQSRDRGATGLDAFLEPPTRLAERSPAVYSSFKGCRSGGVIFGQESSAAVGVAGHCKQYGFLNVEASTSRGQRASFALGYRPSGSANVDPIGQFRFSML